MYDALLYNAFPSLSESKSGAYRRVLSMIVSSYGRTLHTLSGSICKEQSIAKKTCFPHRNAFFAVRAIERQSFVSPLHAELRVQLELSVRIARVGNDQRNVH